MHARFSVFVLAVVAIAVALILIQIRKAPDPRDALLAAPTGAKQVHEETATGEVSSTPALLLPTRASNFRNEFDRTDDLFTLVGELRPYSKGGDAEATRLIARAHDECFLFSTSGSLGFRKLRDQRATDRPDLAARIKHAFDRIAQRCRRFEGQPIRLAEFQELSVTAAAQGSLAAAAERFRHGMISDPEAHDAEHQRMLAEQVLRSRDPEAIAEMAVVMGGLSRSRIDAMKPLPAGSPMAEAAWQIYACRLGRTCGLNSPALVNACVGAGIGCASSSIEDLYLREMLPPAEHDRVRHLVKVLMDGEC